MTGGSEQVVPYISERTIAELKEYYPDALPVETKSLPEALSQINADNLRNIVEPRNHLRISKPRRQHQMPFSIL